jgi:hypothetical protein
MYLVECFLVRTSLHFNVEIIILNDNHIGDRKQVINTPLSAFLQIAIRMPLKHVVVIHTL